ncbi:MAG TPA: hypothetical protein PLO48_14570 [Saprospiraceae bacterium]|nr:hypothetical protein [Saprospiraceae bacterium]
MSNKAKSRKRKQFARDLKSLAKKVSDVVYKAVCLRVALLKLREMEYPKLATGGIVPEKQNGVQISGGEAIIPVISTGTAPYENDQYMFQED